MFRCRLVHLAAATGAFSASHTLRQTTPVSPPRPNERQLQPQTAAEDVNATLANARAATHWDTNPTARHPEYAAADGYNFMERLQALGPRKALKGTHNRLVVYGIIGAACAMYLFYFLTTRTYVLTTNKSPFKNSMFQHFPSDYAIVENKWTGKQTIECVTVDDADAESTETDTTNNAAVPVTSAKTNGIVTRELHINILLDRVYLYLQPTDVVVLVDSAAELQPYRFVKGSIDMTRQSTAGWQRGDQRLPDTTDDTSATTSPRKHWWQLGRRAGQKHDGTVTAASEEPSGQSSKNRLYIQSRVRLLDDYNGYQRGSKPTYENTLQTVVKSCLAAHYRERIIARGASEVRRTYADVMLQNGSLNGEGIILSDVIPDLEAFNKEVFDEVQRRMGNRIILYEHSITLFH